MIGETVLEVKNISDGGKRVKNVSFQAYSGEVLGFAGLVGAGRTETMRMIFGADKRYLAKFSFGEKLWIFEVREMPFAMV